MESTLEFGVATESDVPALVTLIDSAYRGESSRAGWTHEADVMEGSRTSEAEIRGIVADPDSTMLLVRGNALDGRLLACCQLQRQGERSYFGTFAVDPTRQGEGVGAAVLDYAERLARDSWGSTHMVMTVVRQREELIAYYVRRGFRDTGERTPFPYADERFGRPLRDDLEFTHLEKRLF
ncbi:GNAT family N-acetyltransferase [Leucobacter salsicius]|uniref:GNAT family N-acetyltransferase n=1 Tax=Leucobacter salsicius TaxID=664638 RepID=UPI0003483005|nr:GNAT family N-acetyltransferase [Leucobacter salsicius]